MSVSYLKVEDDVLDALLKLHARFVRRENGGKRLVLRFADLSDKDFSGRDFTDADLTGVLFERTKLLKSKFVRATLTGANFRNADLKSSDLQRADMRGVYLAGADLSFADLSEVDFREGQVAYSDNKSGFTVLRHKKVAGDADNANFTGATLDSSRFNGASANGAVFRDCSMRGVKLVNAQLKNADMGGANLEGANFQGARIEGVSFRDAILTKTDFGAMMPSAEATAGALMSPDEATMAMGPKLREMAMQHQEWWETSGAAGRHANFDNQDIRPIATLLRGMRLTALSAKGATATGVFFM